ncbi:hypothetical protein PN488_04185 [Nodularia spumigena CS-591/12]|nr:hypothetical protein [Nodularia spumigena]MDB9303583.1 hypothetical protein [Nodularia spumigena CS-591/12]MDB9335479.1 hypothetical protein [Nodularia spumigena CS-590/01]MDB9349657.1 hypothetical protein [Nodularia spumigena CS-588/01]
MSAIVKVMSKALICLHHLNPQGLQIIQIFLKRSLTSRTSSRN